MVARPPLRHEKTHHTGQVVSSYRNNIMEYKNYKKVINVFPLYSRILAVLGAVLIVSGATLFVAPQTALALQDLGTLPIIQNSHDTSILYNNNGDSTLYLRVCAVPPPISVYDSKCYMGIYSSTSYQALYVGSGTMWSSQGFTWNLNSQMYLVETYTATDNTTGRYYHLYFVPFLNWDGNGANSGQVYFSPYSPPPPPSTDPLVGTTHIASTTPSNYQVVATSTSFYLGVSGEITPTDFTSTSKVKISYYNQSLAQAVVSPSVVTDTQEWNLATSGVFSFATTTDFSKKPLGVYLVTATISHDMFSIFGFSFWEVDDTVYSSQFDVSSSTTHAYYTNYDAISAYAHGSSGSPNDYGVMSPPQITTCNFNFLDASTSLSSAMQCLFIPSQTDLTKAGQNMYNNIFTLFPLGYLTRFISIVASTTPVEPPAMTYRFGSSSPAVLQSITAGDPISFNVFDHFDKVTQIRADDGTNKTIWDIVDPYFTVVVSLAVLLSMISDLIGFEIPHQTDEERMSKIDYDSMSDDEFKKRVKINDYSDESDEHFNNLKRNRLI